MKSFIEKNLFIFFFSVVALISGNGCVQSTKPTTTPPSPPPKFYETYSPPLKLYVKESSVNIRSGPGIENEVIASVKKGQLIRAYGKKDDWYYIQLKGVGDGYIRQDLLTQNKPKYSPQDAASSSDSTQQTGASSSTNQTPTLVDPTLMEDKPKTPAPAPLSNLKPGNARVNSGAAVKVRSSASAFSKVSGELAPGAEVTIIEINGDWCQIRSGALTGYIASFSLVQ